MVVLTRHGARRVGEDALEAMTRDARQNAIFAEHGIGGVGRGVGDVRQRKAAIG